MKQRLQPALLLLALFGSLASAQTPGGRGDVPLGPPVQSTLPDLGSNANTVITKADEYQLGRMMMRDLRQENGYFDDPETTEYLQSVGSRIAVEAQDGGQTFTFFAVRDRSINAFALPGGFIGMNTGLITRTNNESELAGVMAHEIGHVVQRHIARAYIAQRGSSLTALAGLLGAVLIGAVTGSADAGMGVMAMSQGAAMQQQINFTRMEESEADRVGINFLADSGFDPNGMAGFFSIIMRERGNELDEIPSLLLTHPLDQVRIGEARARVGSMTPRPRRPDSESYPFIRERVRVLAAASDSDLRGHYETLRRNDPGNSALVYGAALAEMKSGSPATAAAWLKGLATEQPKLTLLQIALAQAQYAAGQKSEAVATFERAGRLAAARAAVGALCRNPARHGTREEGAPAAARPVQCRNPVARAGEAHRAGRQRRRRHRRCLLLHVRIPHLQRRPDAGHAAAGPGTGLPRPDGCAAQALPGPARGNPRLPARTAQ
ncbi:MAG: M48 family metalloprotease [Proteobacteria bacterium]|nr:M48 family metalloprotease [Pseudomonadota bacterium]